MEKTTTKQNTAQVRSNMINFFADFKKANGVDQAVTKAEEMSIDTYEVFNETGRKSMTVYTFSVEGKKVTLTHAQVTGDRTIKGNFIKWYNR